MKLRTMKFSSEGLGGNSTKFCTSENFPLYGITTDHTTDLVYTDIGSILVLIDTTQDAIRAFDLATCS